MFSFRLGGVDFANCYIPVAIPGRYFIVEPGQTHPMVSVVVEMDGAVRFEILRNQPVQNPVTDVTSTPPGIITVSDKKTGRFLYKVRPDSETSIIFAPRQGTEIPIRFSDRQLIVRDKVYLGENFKIEFAEGRLGIGAQLLEDGTVVMGNPLPQWFSSVLTSHGFHDALRARIREKLANQLGGQVSDSAVDAALGQVLGTGLPTTDGRTVYNIDLGIRRAKEKRLI